MNTKLTSITPQEGIRRRLGAYLGSDARNCAVKEIYNNSQDAFIRNNITNPVLKVTVEGDKITVEDNAGGLPTNKQKDAGGKLRNAMFLVYQPFVGSNFEEDTAGGISGTYGIGSAVTCVSSKEFNVTVNKDGQEFDLRFKDGVTEKEEPKKTKQKPWKNGNGTKVEFVLDDELYSPYPPLDLEALKLDLKYINATIPNLVTKLDIDGEKWEFSYGNGLKGLIPGENVLEMSSSFGFERTRVFSSGVKKIKDRVGYNLILGENSGEEKVAVSFAGFTPTVDGGSHEEALWEAIETQVSSRLKKRGASILKQGENPPVWRDIAPHVSYCIQLNMTSPPFKGFDKTSISDRELKKELTSSLNRLFSRLDEDGEKYFTEIANKALKDARARELARVNRKTKIKKRSSGLSLPAKLSDCVLHYGDKGGEESEVHIVEGDSAFSGLLKQRDHNTQALFPIRGKTTNIYSMTPARALKSEVISDLAKVISGGIVGPSFDPEVNARYGKVIFTADADADGYDIQSLLLLVCYKLFPGLIEAGRVYCTRPPLFIVTDSKGGEHYCESEEERDKITKKLKKGYRILRAKGLGEMGEKSVRNTLLNPKTRTLTRFDVPSEREKIKLEKELTLWFSKDTNKRKQAIIDYAN